MPQKPIRKMDGLKAHLREHRIVDPDGRVWPVAALMNTEPTVDPELVEGPGFNRPASPGPDWSPLTPGAELGPYMHNVEINEDLEIIEGQNGLWTLQILEAQEDGRFLVEVLTDAEEPERVGNRELVSLFDWDPNPLWRALQKRTG